MSVRRTDDPAAARIAATIDAAVAPEGWLGVQAPVDIEARTRQHAELLAADGEGGLWLLEQAGTAVGYATLHERRAGVLSLGMALLPAARGRGGGRMLLAAVVEHGLRSPAHKLDLEVWVENAAAIALYSSAGFVVEGVRRDHYLRRGGRLRSSMLMARRLD